MTVKNVFLLSAGFSLLTSILLAGAGHLAGKKAEIAEINQKLETEAFGDAEKLTEETAVLVKNLLQEKKMQKQNRAKMIRPEIIVEPQKAGSK